MLHASLRPQTSGFMFSNQETQLNQSQEASHEMADHDTLVEFFALLLKVDQRVNPHLYKQRNKEKYD